MHAPAGVRAGREPGPQPGRRGRRRDACAEQPERAAARHRRDERTGYRVDCVLVGPSGSASDGVAEQPAALAPGEAAADVVEPAHDTLPFAPAI
jgi:hypothetical protein